MAGLSPRKFFSKPIRRLKPIERPAEEATLSCRAPKRLKLGVIPFFATYSVVKNC
jgi:hypothetical protein